MHGARRTGQTHGQQPGLGGCDGLEHGASPRRPCNSPVRRQGPGANGGPQVQTLRGSKPSSCLFCNP